MAVALSTEAEYVAASIGGKEIRGLKELTGKLVLPITLPMRRNMNN